MYENLEQYLDDFGGALLLLEGIGEREPLQAAAIIDLFVEAWQIARFENGFSTSPIVGQLADFEADMLGGCGVTQELYVQIIQVSCVKVLAKIKRALNNK